MKTAKQTKQDLAEETMDIHNLNNCKEILFRFLKYSLNDGIGTFNAGQLLRVISLYEQLDELLIELRIIKRQIN